MARRKKSRRRGPKTFRILNALESLTYAEIIARGTTGGGVWSFVTGATDLAPMKTMSLDMGIGNGSGGDALTSWDGTAQISLGDLMTQPGQAIQEMAGNFQSNLIPMAASAFGVSVGFKIGRRLLRKPIANINRNLIVPALGRGIAL